MTESKVLNLRTIYRGERQDYNFKNENPQENTSRNQTRARKKTPLNKNQG